MKRNASKFVWTKGVWQWDESQGAYVLEERRGYTYTGAWALAHTNAVWRATNYRWRNDDGTLSTATWLENENTAHTSSVGPGDTIRLRMDWGETANADSSNVDRPKLQYRVNTGAGFGSWTDVPNTGDSNVNSGTSSQALADGDNETTQRLSGVTGSATYQGSWMEFDEDSGAANTDRTWTDDWTEYEWTLEFNAGRSNGDVFEFRMVALSDGDVPTIDNTPSITLTASQTFNENHSMSGVGTVSLQKQVNLQRAITGTGTSVLSRAATFIKTLTHSAIGTSVLTKGLQFIQTASMTAVGTSVLTKTVTFLQTAAMTATGTVTLQRTFTLIKAIGATGTATLQRSITLIKAISAVGTSALTKGLLFTRSFSFTATGAVVLSTAATFIQNLTHAATGALAFSKTFIPGGVGGSAAAAFNRSVKAMKSFFGRRQ